MSNLYDRSVEWLDMSKERFNKSSGEDTAMDAATFTAQQSLEFIIKHILECRNVQYPKTHDIGVLAEKLRDSGFTFDGQETLDDMADFITKWETESRYGSGVLTTRSRLEKCYYIIQQLYKALENETVPNNGSKLSQLFNAAKGDKGE